MGQALYRSHRPKKLSEVVGQDHITDALSRALKKGAISHAYLFTGPRGTGKTSVARILAHEINELPYEDDSSHLDIIEIDAASNRRIDEIRELRDKVHNAPASAKFKVYIIDEVHMLTKEAFNALLKTLEEPPAHAVFILATTEAHKLPETIISRTQRYTFKPVIEPEVVKHLQQLAELEKIDIDNTALRAIAKHGEGSFRDSISLLDQLRSSGQHIGLDEVQRVLGVAPSEIVDAVHKHLTSRDLGGLVENLKQLREQGIEPAQFAKQLAQSLRASLLSDKIDLPRETHLALLAKLIDVPASVDPWAALEIALLDAALSGAQPDSNPPKPAASAAAKIEAVELEQSIVEPGQPDEHEKTQADSQSNPDLDEGVWSQYLALVKQKHNTLYSFVSAAKPQLEANKLTLASNFTFHQKRLSESHNRQVLSETWQALTGQNVEIDSVVAKTDSKRPKRSLEESNDADHKTKLNAVKDVSNIFGGAELLE